MLHKSKVLKVSILPIVGLSLVSNLSNLFSKADVLDHIKIADEQLVYDLPSLDEFTYGVRDQFNSFLFYANDFTYFRDALAFKESSGRYSVVNKFGYLGKYQFGKGTLALVGVHDTKEFLNSPQLQEKAFIAYLSRNKWVLRKYIAHYVGKKVGGITITESGILAAAHLAGPNSVKKYLRSNGTYVFRDGFGTSIKEYLKKFQSYDLSTIPQNRKAKAAQQNLI